MKNILGIKGLSVSEYAISANAVLGIRDSGKTYTATKAAEELFDAGVPFLALDPIGVWHSLRIPGKGKGYPVVVAGGRHADVPLSVKSAPTIVREAMKANVSVVLDLFSMELSKADWRRIVRDAVEILLHENADHGLRHIFIEEAAEFVPQRVQDGQVFAAVEKLVRMGGNSKLGCTLINQRSADLNKSVLELCANVLVHRQTGKNTLMDLHKWFDVMGIDDAMRRKIAADLPSMKSGECWVLSTELAQPVFVKIPAKNSLHPDRRAAPINTMDLDKHRPVTTKSSATFITDLKAALAPKPKAAPVGVVASPKGPAQVMSQPKGTVVIAIKELEAKLAQVAQEGRAAGWEGGFQAGHTAGYLRARDDMAHAAKTLVMPPAAPPPMPKALKSAKAQPGDALIDAVASLAESVDAGLTAIIERGNSRPIPTFHADASGLGKAERTILGVLANFPGQGCSRAKLALMAGYSANSGSFRNNLSTLRVLGLIGYGDPVALTDAGAAMAPPSALPTGQALLDFWCGHSALGKGERDILTALARALPAGMSRADVAQETGYSASSGSFRNNLSTLRVLGLITGRGDQDLQAAAEFAI